ncbi:uncharacterized protein LOC135825847 isoform X2 [Sycon ciliatum]|uniref:uncharacterized protein LOC135825847 isoform X2 n=1 Tax=Sycon ciliatum TaxID=27933 RepID=UPI0031F61258
MKLSFYCQRYTPNAPSGIAVNSTDTEISARILQPQILRDWVSEFCFVYEKYGTAAASTVVCTNKESTVLSGLAHNTLYRVRAFSKTTIGNNSSMSPEVNIGTLPKAPTTDQVDATSGYQASASGSKSAAIIAGGSGAGLLVLAATVFLLWKLKLTPAKPDSVLTTCQLDVRTQSVSHDDELDLVQNTCTSMDPNEAYESWILARNDAYGCVDLRENDVLRAGCGAGRAEEGGPATEEEHTYVSVQ